MDFPCDKFGDRSFSRFGSSTRTVQFITHAWMKALLTRLVGASN